MGVDVATYRSRIGCCRQNTGHDVVHFSVNINFSRTVKWLCVLPSLLFILLMFINQTTLFGKGTYDLNFLDLSISSSVFTGFHLCLAVEKKTSDVKCPGAVVFIGLLLIKAGIEANPGPLPKEEETQKQTNEGLRPYTHGSSETELPKPDVNRSLETEPPKPDVNRSHEVEPPVPDGNWSLEVEPSVPDADRSPKVETPLPDVDKSPEVEPSVPDAGRSHEVETSVPDVDKSPEVEPTVPDAERSHEVETSVPDVDKSPEVEPSVPDDERSHEVETSLPDVDKSHEVEPLVPDAERAHEVETSVPDVDMSPEVEPLVPDADRSPEVENPLPDVDKSPEAEPPMPDADRSFEGEPPMSDVEKSPEAELPMPDANRSFETEPPMPDVDRSSTEPQTADVHGFSAQSQDVNIETEPQEIDKSPVIEPESLDADMSSKTEAQTQENDRSLKTQQPHTQDTDRSLETGPPMPDVEMSPPQMSDVEMSSEAELQTPDGINSPAHKPDIDRSSKTEPQTQDADRSHETEPRMPDVEISSEAEPQTPDVSKSQTPDVESPLAQTPDVDRSLAETPHVDISSEKEPETPDDDMPLAQTPDVERSSEKVPQTPDIDRPLSQTPDVGRSSEAELQTSNDETSPETSHSGKSSYKQALERHAVDIREKLGLAGYFPGKITLEDTVKISTKPKGSTATELPWLLLQELIMVNFEARDECPYNVYKQMAEQKDYGSEESSDEDDEDDEVDDDTEFQFDINILKNHDIFMTVFNCCDQALKQVLVSKLFSCRLAVPLIYPTFQSDSICFSLWPLRCIHLDLKEEKNVSMFLAEHPQKVVSFIRISRPDYSKSTLLNAILLKQSTGHPAFYDRRCLLGNKKREITNGLVESSWYVPSGQSDDIYRRMIMFTNLRGDALNHKKQVGLLTAISNCLVITIDCGVLHIHLDFLKQLQAECKSILLLLTGKGGKSVSKKYKKDLGGIFIMRLTKKEENLPDFKLEMQKYISELLKSSHDTSLEKCAFLADEHGIPVDEFIDICQTSKKDAETLAQQLDLFDPIVMKKNLLPLHGKLWKDISECTKELKRTDTNVSQNPKGEDSSESSIWRKEPIKAKIKELRQEQFRLGNESLAKLFIQCLEKHLDNEEYISHFLRWVRYYLDNKSYTETQALMPNYQRLWEEFNETKETDTEENVEKIIYQLRVEKEKLEDVSIGVDHILRDVGQLFESNRLLNSDCHSDAWFNYLPGIAAKLLLRGYPMQLLDGDASNIPTTWIEEVFQSCKELIGNKSVYIISIMGVQSSGKSTFLNCLFGLQFPVSVGRCTKGAYMQMLPVDPTCELAADYIIVLDTEGLRAPELDEQCNRDNEIATFAVGISNLTIVNIKGENIKEVRDMLEIVIHALLSLKLANANLRFNTSCLFVHQNVSASNASDKMQESQQKLMKQLDDVTKESARQLGLTDTKTFRQVIQFDIQKDVWYVPDLWSGVPPMAHINPGYSRKVASIKNSILEQMQPNVCTSRTLTTTVIQILDLWNGILTQDFVFSFRNSLEVKAYNMMESEYRKHTWTLQEFQMKWVLQNRDKIGKDSIEKEFDTGFRKKSEEMLSSLTSFFENSDFKQELVKWKDSQLILFKRFISELNNTTKAEFAEILIQNDLQEKTRKINSGHLDDIHEQAKDLAKSLKGEQPSEKELKMHFDRLWSKWLKRLPSAENTEIESLEDRIIKILQDYKHKERCYICQEIEKQTFSCELEDLVGSAGCLEYGYETHIHIKHSSTKQEKERVIQEKCQTETEQFQQHLFTDINSKITEYLNKSVFRFRDGHLDELLDIINSKIDEHNSKSDFEFLPQYRAMIMVYVSRYVLHVFTKVNERYDEENSPRAILEKYKDMTYTFFRNLVYEKTQNIIVASFISEAMKNKLNATLQQHVAIEIESRVRAEFSHCKYSLIIRILDYLAAKEDFDLYKEYLTSPHSYALKWVTEYSNDRFFIKSEYVDIVDDFVAESVKKLKKEIKEAAKKCETVEERKMETFISSITEVSIPDYTAKQMCEYELNDVDDFLSELNHKLSDLQTEIREEHEMKSPSSIEWKQSPYQRIIQGLWGCTEVCPFCGEPCQKMEDHDENNEPHTCIQHRPEGIHGIRNSISEKLAEENCSFLVQSDQTATCSVFKKGCRKYSDCEGNQYHPYKNYKKYVPDWDIAPSSDMDSSKYWMWFIVMFNQQLAEWHNAREADIPGSWTAISKQDARNSLRLIDRY